MANDRAQIERERKDFFISYTGKDSQWAQWIAFELEAAGYHTIIQAWDIRPGSNFVAEMEEAATRALQTILVLSEAYLVSEYTFAEWATAFRSDPKGKQGKVLPVRIERYTIEGLLGSIGYIDLVELDELQAREKLLKGVKRERAKPAHVPFPAYRAPTGPLVGRPVFPGSLPPIWNVLYSHNPFFTGRDELLSQLHNQLHIGQVSALSHPQAIIGLGGIGKTQIALEYAYRHRGDYQAVLWAQAETRDTLTSSYLAIAALLNLPEKSEQESARVIAAVKNWLQRSTNWLLILDNADDLALARDFLPPSFGGHIFLTTRAQATGRFARRLEIDTLPTEQGALFLLRRSGLLAPDGVFEQAHEHDRDQARAICEELGGLPLALDQAGAYIEETECSLSEYQRLYQDHRADLLAERRGQLVDDHPLPVATTWSLSFTQVEQKNAAAADLLRLCAFLAPDAIPEEIITQGAQHLGLGLAPVAADPYLLNQAIETLRAYSLLRREASSGTAPLLSVHRLVQAVLKDQMDDQSNRQQWAERAVHTVNAALPPVDDGNWPTWERVLAHALVGSELIGQQNLRFADAVHLLQQTGWYLATRTRYYEAKPLLERALSITKQEQGSEHLEATGDTTTLLRNLGQVSWKVGKNAQAEAYLQEGLTLARQIGDPERISDLLLTLGTVAGNQGNYAQEMKYLQEGVALARKIGDRERICEALIHLGVSLTEQGNYTQGEIHLQEGLAVARKIGHKKWISALLANLGSLVSQQGNYTQAEIYLLEGLALAEQIGQPEWASVLTTNLGLTMRKQGNFVQAELYLQRGVGSARQLDIPQLQANALYEYGNLYVDQQKLATAEGIFREMLVTAPEECQDLIALAHYGLARTAAAQSNMHEALQLGEASVTTLEKMGHYRAQEVRDWFNSVQG
jgi:tetratricopeptide (TPR) repeat protein